MELELNPHCTPFDLDSTLRCGQLFRWEKRGGSWYGVVKGRVLKVWQKDRILGFEGADFNFVKSYFRLDDDLPQIVLEISRDPMTKRAVKAFPGLRLARQDPWECLLSYVCATYKNIPAIKNMIFNLSESFGHEVSYEGYPFYAFPEPQDLAAASISELGKCKLGYRARLVREAALKVSHSEIDLEQLKKVDYETAKAELLQIPGVGNKVADCVLLFSLEKLEAFPVDVWMRRIIEKHYSRYFEKSFIDKVSDKASLSKKAYDTMGAFARGYFGRYAGYAQEYLFHFARSQGVKGQV
jgi:N-glycosylase/DNA lyase